MRALLLLLTVALAAPSALAQVPGLPQPCADITVPEEPAVPAPIAPGSSVDVSVTVRNPNPGTVSVTVTADPPPPGWEATTPPEATIGASSTATFLFTVTARDSATDDWLMRFSATGSCDTPATDLCGEQCSAGSANTQVLVPLQADGGFTFPSLGGLSPELLIAGIVLIGLASIIPFAMRRKKGGVVADCPEPLKMVRAGRGTSFPIEIRNASKDAATAQFEVGPVPEGWSAFMPLPEVQLAAREARSLWLMVRSPQEAKVGDAVDVELRLRDPKRGGANGAVVKVRAEVQGGPEA